MGISSAAEVEAAKAGDGVAAGRPFSVEADHALLAPGKDGVMNEYI